MTDQIITRCQRCDRFHHASEPCRLKWWRRGFLSMIGIAPLAIATAPAVEIPKELMWNFYDARGVFLGALPASKVQAWIDRVFITCEPLPAPFAYKWRSGVNADFDHSTPRVPDVDAIVNVTGNTHV